MSTGALLRAERQFRLSLLSSRLDIAKARSILHRSLDAHAANARDPAFLIFFHQGKVVLLYALGCQLSSTPTPPSAAVVSPASPPPAPTDGSPRAADITAAADTSTETDAADRANPDAFGLGKRSKLLESAVKACVVDDVNLAAAFEALRLEELLEGCYQTPPIEFCSAIVLAVLGELHTVRQVLLDGGGPEARPTVEFIERTLQQFTSLLIETGRDRYTYIKESLVSSILTPSRPCLGQKPAEDRPLDEVLSTKDSFTLSGLLDDDFDWPSGFHRNHRSFWFGLYNRGDIQLEVLLASGSVPSLLRRLQLLQQKNGLYAVDLIRFAVIRQAPLLNRFRQLTFTRVMHALACPLGRTAADERARAAVRSASSLNAYRATLRILAEALFDCGVATWCYETDVERSAICCVGLPPYCGRRLSQILCIKVSRSMLDSPANWELPEAEVLSKQFLDVREGGPRPSQYTQLFFSQQLQRLDVNIGAEGASKTWRSDYSLVASHLQRATPDFFTAGAVDEVKFFTSPILTAFKDTSSFKQTLADFFVVKDVEEEPAIWSTFR